MKHTELTLNIDGEKGDFTTISTSEGWVFDVISEHAEFIVRSCNNHYKLIEALKIAEESLRNITGFKGTAKTFKNLISDIEGK